MTRQTPVALYIREYKMPYLLKGKYRDNENIGSSLVYIFLVVVISSIYEVIFDLAGDALFFATGL